MAYSYNEVGAIQPEETIAVSFPFLSREHVSVLVDGVQVEPYLWEWVNDGLVKALAGFPVGTTTRVRRVTPVDSIGSTLVGGAVFNYDGVNSNDLQIIFSLQELLDSEGLRQEQVDDIQAVLDSVIQDANDAVQLAEDSAEAAALSATQAATSVGEINAADFRQYGLGALKVTTETDFHLYVEAGTFITPSVTTMSNGPAEFGPGRCILVISGGSPYRRLVATHVLTGKSYETFWNGTSWAAWSPIPTTPVLQALFDDRYVRLAGTNDLTGGAFACDAKDEGTKTSGTYIVASSGGPLKKMVNGGAFVLSPYAGTGDWTAILQITNGVGAGPITITGFSKVGGDLFTTTVGDDFFVYITKINGFTQAIVQALQ